MENTSLRDRVFELDSELGNLECSIETLDDIKQELTLLCTDMNEELKNRLNNNSIEAFHRKIRLLSELMSFTIEDIKSKYDRSNSMCSDVYNEVI